MQIREYEIGTKVYQDGIGTLYHADNVETAERAYLKVLNRSHASDPDFVRSFHECADVYCSQENKNQLQTLGHGHENGWHFIILDYSDFRPLDSALSEHSMLSVMEAVTFIERVASGLRTYHLEGLVHGHLTPQNIFVDRDLTQIKLADLGFAPFIRLLLRKSPQDLSAALPYFAPELKSPTVPIDRRTDVFAIGVLFYQLLLKELPGVTMELGDEVHEESGVIIPPSLQRLEIPECLDQLILSALEHEPQQRSKNLSEFINRLSEAKSVLSQAAGMLKPSGDDQQSRHSAIVLAPEMSPSLSEDEPSDGDDGAPTDGMDEGEKSASAESDEPSGSQESQSVTDSDSNGHGPPGKASSVTDSQLTEEEGSTRSNFEVAPNEDETSDHPKGECSSSSDNGQGQDWDTDTQWQQSDEDGSPSLSSEFFKPSIFARDESNGNGHSEKDEDSGLMSPGGPESAPRGEYRSDDFRNGSGASLTDELTPVATTSTERTPSSTITGPASKYAAKVAQNQLVDIFEGDEKPEGPAACSNYADPPTLDDVISQVEDDDRGRTTTRTAEFATTDTINIYRPKLSGPFLTPVQRILMVALALILSGVLAFTVFDFNWFESSQPPALKPEVADPPQEAGLEEMPVVRLDAGAEKEQPKVQLPKKKLKKPAVAPQKSKAKPRQEKSVSAAISLPVTKSETTEVSPEREKIVAKPTNKPPMTAPSDPVEPTVTTTDPLSQPTSVLLKLHIKHGQIPQKADVYLDGKLMGRSDANGLLSIPKLKRDNPYLVKVECTGFQMWAKEISFKQPGFNHLHVGLQALGQEESADVQPPIQPQQKGKVTVILSNPQQVNYGFIYINGELWKDGIAPAELELPQGTYVFELKKDGFRSDPSAQTVEVKGGERTSVRFQLNPE